MTPEPDERLSEGDISRSRYSSVELVRDMILNMIHPVADSSAFDMISDLSESDAYAASINETRGYPLVEICDSAESTLWDQSKGESSSGAIPLRKAEPRRHTVTLCLKLEGGTTRRTHSARTKVFFDSIRGLKQWQYLSRSHSNNELVDNEGTRLARSISPNHFRITCPGEGRVE